MAKLTVGQNLAVKAFRTEKMPADHELFQLLLTNHGQIRRTVNKRPDGVETLTESDDPTVALAIQGHAAAMKRRVEQRRPIHFRAKSGSGRLSAGFDAPTEATDVPELARLGAEQGRSGPADAALVHRALEAIRAEFEAAVWESFWQLSVAGRPAADVARELDGTAADVRDGNYRVLHRLRQELDEMR